MLLVFLIFFLRIMISIAMRSTTVFQLCYWLPCYVWLFPNIFQFISDICIWCFVGCGTNLKLPTLSPNLACRLSHLCTGVQCCLHIPILERLIEAHAFLDVCNYKLSIGLEKLVLNISMFDYNYNTWKTISLGNMIRLRYYFDICNK